MSAAGSDPRRASESGQLQVADALNMMLAIRDRLRRYGAEVPNHVMRQAMEDFAREANRMQLGAMDAIEAIRRLEVR